MPGHVSSVSSLDVVDVVVFCVLTAVGYLVGLYFSFARRFRQVTPGDSGGGSAVLEAFLGGRTLPASALAVSVLASVATAASVVSFVGHYYTYGFHVDWVLVGIPLAAFVAAFALVPVLYGHRVASIFQYLRMRFDNKVGVTACVVYFILSQSVGAVGIFSSAIALSTMFPVPLAYCDIGIGLAGTIYTALGGLRGVVWADCAQAFVMVLSPLVIISKVIYDSNFVSPPLRPMTDANLTDFWFRTSFDATNDENFWSGMAGALAFSFVRTGFDQMAVQRFMAARTLREAKGIAIAGPLFVFVFFFLGDCTGIAIIYWFRDCDPVLRGSITSYDQVVPYYLKTSLSDVPVLRGIFLAGLVGASTSTVSSIVNSHAAIFYIDLVMPYFKISDQRAVFVMRLLAFASGTIMTLCAVAVPYMGTAASLFMSFYTSAAGPFTGLILLAISSPWTNSKGVAWATLLVCGLQLWHAVGRSLSNIAPVPLLPKSLDRCPPLANTTDTNTENISMAGDFTPKNSAVFPLYQISYYWISLIGLMLTMVLGTALSLMTGGGQNAERNLRFTSPLFVNFWRRFRFLRNKFQIEETEMKNSIKKIRYYQGHEDEQAALDT
ncbi:sodium-coupled monocarboxylate transporter 1-like [Amblyomma americanum]